MLLELCVGATEQGAQRLPPFWHNTVMGSSNMADHDRKSIRATEAARHAGKGTSISQAFDATKAYETSLGENDLLSLTKPATWPKHGPPALASVPSADACCDAMWRRLDSASQPLAVLAGSSRLGDHR